MVITVNCRIEGASNNLGMLEQMQMYNVVELENNGEMGRKLRRNVNKDVTFTLLCGSVNKYRLGTTGLIGRRTYFKKGYKQSSFG